MLTSCCFLVQGTLPVQPVLQALTIKPMPGQPGATRYRVNLSDGQSMQGAMLGTGLNTLVTSNVCPQHDRRLMLERLISLAQQLQPLCLVKVLHCVSNYVKNRRYS